MEVGTPSGLLPVSGPWSLVPGPDVQAAELSPAGRSCNYRHWDPLLAGGMAWVPSCGKLGLGPASRVDLAAES